MFAQIALTSPSSMSSMRHDGLINCCECVDGEDMYSDVLCVLLLVVDVCCCVLCVVC